MPEPVPPEVTVNHDAELDAVREQPRAAVTVSDPVVAADDTVRVVGETAYEQVPLCVTLKDAVPTLSVAVRADDDALAATL